MNVSTTLRLAASGGGSDRIRIALTAIGAALPTVALLSAATVAAIPGHLATRYTNALLNEAGLRPGVAFGLVLLAVPCLAFVAQCSRIGAPAQERRLAAIRMAGGSPRQVMWITAVGTGLTSLLGVGLGFAAYLSGRLLLDTPNAQGLRPLPTDVLPHPVAMVAVAAGVPLFVTLLAVLALRRVAVGPLGVARDAGRGRPGRWPGVLLLCGTAAWLLVEPLYRVFERQRRSGDLPAYVLGGLVLIGLVAVSVGVVTGTGWITYAAGRCLHRCARRPAALLAGRRMMADPWAGSRTFAAMLVALVIGSAAAGLGAMTMAGIRTDEENSRRLSELEGVSAVPFDRDDFYVRAYQLVGYAVTVSVMIAAAGLVVALADSIVARRRTLASLVAAGTPRGVLARAIGWQVLTPVVPAVALAVATGLLMPRALPIRGTEGNLEAWRCVPAPGDPMEACNDLTYARAHEVMAGTTPRYHAPVDLPWHEIQILAGGAIAACVLVTAVGLLFLRTSTRTTELRTP